jgi:hypothetical protein
MTTAATQQTPIDHRQMSHLPGKTMATNVQMPVNDESSTHTSPDREHHDTATTDGAQLASFSR